MRLNRLEELCEKNAALIAAQAKEIAKLNVSDAADTVPFVLSGIPKQWLATNAQREGDHRAEEDRKATKHEKGTLNVSNRVFSQLPERVATVKATCRTDTVRCSAYDKGHCF